MLVDQENITGLTDEELASSLKKFGSNRFDFKKENEFIAALKSLLKEPMVILLFVTSLIYFISGSYGDGIFLAVAILLVAAISIFQDKRSRDALENLKDFSKPRSRVIRNGELCEISTEDIVMGDYLMIEEGEGISADASIIHSNDFAVNESILTGESFSVPKNKNGDQVYSGTQVTSGLAIAIVNAIGNGTKLGKIGKSIEEIAPEETPLEKQIASFVKKMIFVGAVVFLIVWAINFFQSHDIFDSLLKALTLAMSILPEEIPVAFTTFMAMGAWRLMKSGVIVKQMKTVETLGGATVICTDKTGTITENRMSLAKLYDFAQDQVISMSADASESGREIVRVAMWASEPIPYDPMELAIHNGYEEFFQDDERSSFSMAHEYPLGGTPPMMTHIFKNAENQRIIAAKGAPEAIIKVCRLNPEDAQRVHKALNNLASQGYRVLGVCKSKFEGSDFPEKQQDLPFDFMGLVAFYDPPKANINQVLQDFYAAGIEVKIITGDNELTTAAIAREIGFKGIEQSISGTELMALNDEELSHKVSRLNIFTRMFPEAKLRIINALKDNGEIVAMTGDGVNDGPALKAAHIGIAMGIKGSEIAKRSAALVLLEDDLSKMVEAVANGRKIYTNLKKAIQYIISIHIPIILTVFIPLALSWIYPAIFLPIHVILLELIMGPTCSIIYENEPMEANAMKRKPRALAETFFNWSELTISIIQGLAITAGTLFIYQWAVSHLLDEGTTRALVFSTLIFSNIALTLVNRSFYYSIFTTLKIRNNLVLLIIGVTLLLLLLMLIIEPFRLFFKFGEIDLAQLLFCALVGIVSVVWFEVFKFIKRRLKD